MSEQEKTASWTDVQKNMTAQTPETYLLDSAFWPFNGGSSAQCKQIDANLEIGKSRIKFVKLIYLSIELV